MADGGRDVWITGIGIVSCLGEGPDVHWQALNEGRSGADTTRFAPYVVHPLAPVDLDKQIPKKGDQRQMESWQRIGTYAAGLALDSAGLKGNSDLLAQTDLIVAAGGGERDYAVDAAILAGLPKAQDPGAYLNERLMNDLRPTLFLAQLSNLLAGNISIVHGVTRSSRTFMGEEAAGVDALRIAAARIVAGQSDIILVGGAHNGERKDLLLLYEAGGFALKQSWAPVFERGEAGGMALGSLGAFVVLESADHARRRSARAWARLTRVLAERATTKPGARAEMLKRMWEGIERDLSPSGYAILSGATGAEPATREEGNFLKKHSEVPIFASGSYIGHGMEAQFPMNVSLAALALGHGQFFAAAKSPAGQPRAPLRQVVVTGVGHWRGEGMALVEASPERGTA
jgi:3-oxoacyl-[acyl-carrier-protein] synthase II